MSCRTVKGSGVGVGDVVYWFEDVFDDHVYCQATVKHVSHDENEVKWLFFENYVKVMSVVDGRAAKISTVNDPFMMSGFNDLYLTEAEVILAVSNDIHCANNKLRKKLSKLETKL